MSICRACSSPLPAEARFCPACGAATAESAVEPWLAPSEERKLVTIVFADIAGSTSLGERMDPEALNAVLRRYFAAMAEVLERWGGRVEKYIGDAIVAVFGLPGVREDDAERAVRAALQMQARLAELNDELDRRHALRLAVRIGVNSGEVIVPAEGAGPMVAGDAINVAARLQQLADAGAVVVGNATYLAVRDRFELAGPLELEAKGKSRPVTAWRLVRAATLDPGSGRPPRTPLVGRGQEMEALLTALAGTVEAGEPRLAVVVGAPGVGKSRLVRELEARAVGSQPRLRVLRGRSLAAGQRTTFGALDEVLRSACGVREVDPTAVARERLRRTVLEALGNLRARARDVEETVEALAFGAGISVPDSRLAAVEPREVAAELGRAWPRLLSGLAADRPLLVVLEDMHWATDAMVDMLPRLLEARGPLLLVATTRPEAETGWLARLSPDDGALHMDLAGLSSRESEALLEDLLGARELPAVLRRAALDRAEGNPFFLEEIVRHLLESAGDMLVTELPHSIHALLAARIDALPALPRRVVREAAVIGRSFRIEPVASAVGAPIEGAVEVLTGHGLIVAQASADHSDELAFRHALVREVAYGGLSKRRRALAHAGYAAWLEAHVGDERHRWQEIIAEHYRAALSDEGANLAWADDPAAAESVRLSAFEAFLAAGELLRGRSAVARALELHEAAFSLARGELEQARALEAVGDDHYADHHGDEAWSAMTRALEFQRRIDRDGSARARLAVKLSEMGAVRWGMFRTRLPPAAVELITDEGLAVARDDANRAQLLGSKAHLGLRWLAAGSPDPVGAAHRIVLARKALATARRSGMSEAASTASMALAQLHAVEGDFGQALLAAEAALPLDERLEVGSLSTGFWSANVVAEVGGRFEQALPHVRRALDRGRRMSAHHAMHGTYTTMNVLFHLGRWEEIPALLEEHLAALRSEGAIGCPYVRGGAPLGALVLAHLGEAARARELLAEVANGTSGLLGTPEAIVARARVALGEPDEGLRIAEEVLAAGRRISTEENAYEHLALLEAVVALGDRDQLRRALPRVRPMSAALAVLGPAADRAEGAMMAAEGRQRAGERLLRGALAAFESSGVAFEAALTREVLAAANPEPEARRLRAAAAATYRALGATPHLARIEAASS